MDKGLKILLQTYWGSQGWRYKAASPEAILQAKEEGYMFDEVCPLTHDETLSQLTETVRKVSATDVANAFLYSLSTRQLQYRSALGSYYYALAIPEHSHKGQGTCYDCNWLEDKDYNVLNFERYKWGGVRHTYPGYVLFDLQQFLLLPKVNPTKEDWHILKLILDTISELPPKKKVGAYRDLISKKKLFPANKSEISVLLNILGICGVLSSQDAPCYCDCFADVWHRSPREHTNDFAYPVNWWHAEDGVNEEWFYSVFGSRYSEL